MNLERVKDTINCLLNLARNDGATQGEVDNAMAFARKLMLEHQLSESDLHVSEETQEEQIARAECGKYEAFGGATKLAAWEGWLAMFVCKFVGGVQCYAKHNQVRRAENGLAVMDKGRPSEACQINFVGICGDADFARSTFKELCVLIAAMARLKYGGVFRGPGRSYAEGFVQGLIEKMKATDVEVGSSSSTALVVRRDAVVLAKTNRAKQWLAEQEGIKLGRGRRRGTGGQHHNAAYGEGQTDGRKTNVGKPAARLGGEQKRLGNG